MSGIPINENVSGDHRYTLKDVSISSVTESFIFLHTAEDSRPEGRGYQYIVPKSITINQAVFGSLFYGTAFPDVTVAWNGSELQLSCSCGSKGDGLCGYQSQVLTAVVKREELRVFFDEELRNDKLKKTAADYGLENEPDPGRFFELTYQDKQLLIKPRTASLMPVTRESLYDLRQFLAAGDDQPLQTAEHGAGPSVCVVLRQHKYYHHLTIGLYRAETTRDGNIRNPLTPLNPADMIWQAEEPEHIRFFSAVARFQSPADNGMSDHNLEALRTLIRNPLGYPFYCHDRTISENVSARSVVPVKISRVPVDICLTVNRKDAFYEVKGTVAAGGHHWEMKDLAPWCGYFLRTTDRLYLVNNLQSLHIAGLLIKKEGAMLVHHSKYPEFKTQIISKLEDRVTVDYAYISQATPLQLKQQGVASETEKIIYLSDFGQYVMIIPVMRYGDAEVPLRTKRQISSVDHKGNEFLIRRDREKEDEFMALLIRQHPAFEEQLENSLYYLYLHKKRFLDEEWFLNAFDEWQSHDITILGFNEIEKNRLSQHKVKISVQVLSGIDWFNADVTVRYGKKKASLKQVYRAVINRTRYVQLDDGTQGILPAGWIERFAAWFQAGEIADDDTLRIPKVNFSDIERLYDEEMLDAQVRLELESLKERLNDTNRASEVQVPSDFTGTLRPYQQQGLCWLNVLDHLGFGGCLADDMGLGKSAQIIAFVLSLRRKHEPQTHLLIAPASLIFNWQAEFRKFAPSVKVLAVYGSGRIRNTDLFDQYDVILTSYGTMLSDISFLKKYTFSYIFLDESQNIKNPGSQRYKAARLLRSANRIVITGTPVENNTFDLYAQLSFACPGLLGSKRYFKDIYSSPVDKFQDSKRAAELRAKIKPFILRRTKQQVAAELPDKTEMVLYCEMNDSQRKLYEAYEREFREYISAASDDELKKSPMNVLKGLMKLRQICNSPLLLKGEKLKGEDSAKMDVLMEQIEMKSPQHKILVFSQFVSMLDLVRKELTGRGIGFAYLTGSTVNREAVITGFQQDPGIRVFLISLKAGGTGLNLTAADYVYLLEPWWNPAVENQAIDRAHRIGQKNKVIAVRLICPETVEEKMMSLQQSKRDLAGELIKADAPVVSSLSRAELLQLLK